MSEEPEMTFEEKVMYLNSFGPVHMYHDRNTQQFIVKAECMELFEEFVANGEANAPICVPEEMLKGMHTALDRCVDDLQREWKKRDDAHIALINSLTDGE